MNVSSMLGTNYSIRKGYLYYEFKLVLFLVIFKVCQYVFKVKQLNFKKCIR